ncbi:hypothetical protein ACWGTI_22710 [Mesorhizobium sp. ArgA1]
MILLDLESALEEASFDVVGSKNGSEAIATFEDSPEKFRALLSDMRLGEGPSGWEVARHIRKVNPTHPGVYISGDSALHWGAEGSRKA